jgi:hypothetical protein
MNSTPTVAMDMPPCDVLALGMAEAAISFKRRRILATISIASENPLDWLA